MLVIFDTDTGDIIEAVSVSAWPEGPPDERAWENIDAAGIDRAGLDLLRLHDTDDAGQVAIVNDPRPARVDPATRVVEFTGEPAPEPPEPSPEEQRAAELRAKARNDRASVSQADVNEAVRLALAEGRI